MSDSGFRSKSVFPLLVGDLTGSTPIRRAGPLADTPTRVQTAAPRGLKPVGCYLPKEYAYLALKSGTDTTDKQIMKKQLKKYVSALTNKGINSQPASKPTDRSIHPYRENKRSIN